MPWVKLKLSKDRARSPSIVTASAAPSQTIKPTKAGFTLQDY